MVASIAEADALHALCGAEKLFAHPNGAMSPGSGLFPKMG